MNTDNKSRLDALMKKHKENLLEKEKKQAIVKSEEDNFIIGFKKLIKEVISPAMKDVGEELKTHGYTYEIDIKEHFVDSQGKTHDTKITMYFSKGADTIYKNEVPSVSFIATPYKKTAWVHYNTIMPGRGGTSSSRGEYPLEKITSNLVENEILKVVEEAFVRAY